MIKTDGTEKGILLDKRISPFFSVPTVILKSTLTVFIFELVEEMNIILCCLYPMYSSVSCRPNALLMWPGVVV